MCIVIVSVAIVSIFGPSSTSASQVKESSEGGMFLVSIWAIEVAITVSIEIMCN